METYAEPCYPLSKSGAEAPDYYAKERATTMRKVDDAKSTVEPDSFWMRNLTVLAALT